MIKIIVVIAIIVVVNWIVTELVPLIPNPYNIGSEVYYSQFFVLLSLVDITIAFVAGYYRNKPIVIASSIIALFVLWLVSLA